MVVNDQRVDSLREELSRLRARVAELERSEERLQRANAELQDFVERASVGLHWVSEDGTILWANQAELDMLGYQREEYIGHHIAEFHADGAVIDDILQRLGNNETLVNYEARLRCKDGSVRYVLINSNVRWDDDEFIHTRCFTRDITARWEAEQRALEAAHELAREREEFLSIAAHELRTPLTTIKGTAQLLVRRLERPEIDAARLAALSRQVEGQVGRMESLVNNLLDVSRLETATMREHFTQGDLREVVAVAYEYAKHSPARTEQHRLALDMPAPVEGWWDAQALDQVVVNLLSNALKYSPAGGDVLVSLYAEGNEAVLAVRDHGVGIAAAAQSDFFKPFSRGYGGNGIAGVGLGLYIVARIVERHVGTVAVDSIPGSGSTFTVRLPIRSEP